MTLPATELQLTATLIKGATCSNLACTAPETAS